MILCLAHDRRAVTPRTKMIIINTPHNPVGKVFSKQELESIAAVAEEFNLLVMSDEVVCTPTLCAQTANNIWTSTTPSYLTEKSMSDSRTFLACGIVP